MWEPADLGLSYRNGNFIAWAIYMWCKIFRKTKSKFSHSFIMVDKRGNLVEASKKVELNHITDYISNPKQTITIFRQVDLSDEAKGFIAGFMLSNVGYLYDVPGFLSFVFPFIKQVRYMWYCSELTNMAYELSGNPIYPERKEKKISPAEQGDWIVQQKNWIKVFEI